MELCIGILALCNNDRHIEALTSIIHKYHFFLLPNLLLHYRRMQRKMLCLSPLLPNQSASQKRKREKYCVQYIIYIYIYIIIICQQNEERKKEKKLIKSSNIISVPCCRSQLLGQPCLGQQNCYTLCMKLKSHSEHYHLLLES